MACPACACKVHYQYDDGNDCGPHTEGLERCAACGHVFDIEDAADDEDDAYGVGLPSGETFPPDHQGVDASGFGEGVGRG